MTCASAPCPFPGSPALGHVLWIFDRDSRAEAAPDDTAEAPKDNQYSGAPAAPPGTTPISTLIDQDPQDTP